MAGSSNNGFADGIAQSASFNNPSGVVLNTRDGCLYVSDTSNHKIRKISPKGTPLKSPLLKIIQQICQARIDSDAKKIVLGAQGVQGARYMRLDNIGLLLFRPCKIYMCCDFDYCCR